LQEKDKEITVSRGTSNTNDRGSAASRRIRKQWVLDTFGNGLIAFCSFLGCKEELDFDTITIDRYPLAGCEGGTYKRGNIRPMCAFHNSSTGSLLGHKRKKEKEYVQ
jgi:hypothetical protein